MLSALVIAGVTALAVTSCALEPTSTPSTPAPETTDSPPVEEEPEAPAGLEKFDFGNTEWLFRPGGNMPETTQIAFVDGEAEVDLVIYTVGDAEFADVNGDGLTDAAVQITRIDGNAFEEQWYLWIATETDPIQVTLPIARGAHCGTAINSVTATSNGIEVDENRRRIDEDGLACSETGSDHRVRVVSAVEVRNEGEWWPITTDPVGFGGLCPVAAEYHGFPFDGDVYAAPDTEAPQTKVDAEFILEGWPVYGEPFPGWGLIGTFIGDDIGCGWVEAG